MKQLLVFLLLLCSASVSAQDVIVKKDGSTILCKVLEVGQEEIKYKKFGNLDGPTYTISKAELQAINYQNGAKDTFSAPVREENRYLPNNQNDGTQQYNDRALLQLDAAISRPDKKAKKLRTTAWIGGGALFAAGVTLFIMYESSSGRVNNYQEWALPLSIACAGGAAAWTTTFLLVANHIESQLSFTPVFQHNIPFSNGTSLSLGADLLNDHTMENSTLGLGLRYNF